MEAILVHVWASGRGGEEDAGGLVW